MSYRWDLESSWSPYLLYAHRPSCTFCSAAYFILSSSNSCRMLDVLRQTYLLCCAWGGKCTPVVERFLRSRRPPASFLLISTCTTTALCPSLRRALFGGKGWFNGVMRAVKGAEPVADPAVPVTLTYMGMLEHCHEPQVRLSRLASSLKECALLILETVEAGMLVWYIIGRVLFHIL